MVDPTTSQQFPEDISQAEDEKEEGQEQEEETIFMFLRTKSSLPILVCSDFTLFKQQQDLRHSVLLYNYYTYCQIK